MHDSSPSGKERLNVSILYVEDEENIRQVLAKILLRKFKEVVTASNGLEGLERYMENKPDIVITDIRMPEMSGIEMSRRIRAIDPDALIVITTAFTDVEHFLDAINLGINRFILKPIDAEKLEESIYELVQTVNKRQDFKNVNQLLNEYKKAVDSSAIVSKTNKRGIITYVNEAFCHISGYSQEELLGKPHNIVRHPITPKQVFKEMWETILAGKIWKGTVQNKKKDGSHYTVEATIVPILDAKGEIVEFIAIRYDITELLEIQKEMERYRVKQLTQSVQKASELRLETLLSALPHPSFIIDSEDTIIAFNHHSEALFDLYGHKGWLEKLKKGSLDFKELADSEESLFLSPIDWKHLILELEPQESKKLLLAIPSPSSRYILGLSRLQGETRERLLLTLTPFNPEEAS